MQNTKKRLHFLNPTLVSAGIGLIAAFILFKPIVTFLVYQQVDYADHLSYLHEVMDGRAVGQMVTMFPHFMYHLLVYGTFKVFSVVTIPQAGLAVSVGAYMLGTLAVYWFLIRMLGRPTRYLTGLMYAGLALALMSVMPIDIFTPENLFVGYIGISAFHNPTIILLKPFAVIALWCAVTVFSPDKGHKRNVPIWVCGLVTVLCIMAKPSYMIALLPALVMFIAYQTVRRRKVDWMLLLWGIAIPAYLTLALQLILFQDSRGFLFAPLAVIYSWTRINIDAPNGIALKFLLSILFPLLVYALYFKTAIKSLYLNLAWLTFGFGAAYMYLLAEGGERLSHANFTWSAISALFILFVASTVFLIQQVRGERRWSYQRLRLAVCSAVFGLHLVSGIYWYYIHLTAISMGDIIGSKW